MSPSQHLQEYAQAEALYKRKRYNSAISRLNNAISIQPNYGEAWGLMGFVHVALKNYKQAEQAFRRWADIDQMNPHAKYCVGFSCESQGRLTEALGFYDAALGIDPKHADALTHKNKLMKAQSAKSSAIKAVARTAPSSILQASRNIQQGMVFERGELEREWHRRVRSFGFPFILSVLTIPIFGVGLLFLVYLYVKARRTRYRVYNSVIEFQSGIIFKKVVPVWLFNIAQTTEEKFFGNILAGDITLISRAPELVNPARPWRHKRAYRKNSHGEPDDFRHQFYMSGLSVEDMNKLHLALEKDRLTQRYFIKGIWTT